jgi:carbamoyl-phosphate synthase/aspartate carbamoyltransferase/dihydroorotase
MGTHFLPGLTDIHVHMREPGGTHKEDFATGTAAALAGGITTVLAMPNTTPPVVDEESLALAEDAACARSRCDYGIYIGATQENIDTAYHLAPKAAGLKFYLDATYGPLQLVGLGILRDHMARWPANVPMVFHAEERSLAAVLLCAHLGGHAVHVCHVSRRAEIELIRDAKERGLKVTCEVSPHHLFLSTDDIPRLGPGWCEVRPPLTKPDDRTALWEYMEFIDCIATDHAPHTRAEKLSGNPPPGFPGLETSLALMLTAVHKGRLTINDIIQRMHDNPKLIFSLPDQPDTEIEVDPEATWTVRGAEMQSRSSWSPFEGWTLRGRVVRTILRGQTVYKDGSVLAEPGIGQNVRVSYKPSP